jgi:hypothetical protein
VSVIARLVRIRWVIFYSKPTSTENIRPVVSHHFFFFLSSCSSSCSFFLVVLSSCCSFFFLFFLLVVLSSCSSCVNVGHFTLIGASLLLKPLQLEVVRVDTLDLLKESATQMEPGRLLFTP